MGDIALRTSVGPKRQSARDVSFAAGIIAILSIFFLPIPAFMIDIGLAFSIALSVLILMVALWIERPLDFSAFPTVLLVATLLRLALNIATTRSILSNGSEGVTAAGYIIGGFSKLVMSGDFVIGLIVFAIHDGEFCGDHKGRDAHRGSWGEIYARRYSVEANGNRCRSVGGIDR